MKRPILFMVLCLLLSSAFGQMRWTRVLEHAPWGTQGGMSVLVKDGKIWLFEDFLRPRNKIWCSADGDSWILICDSAPWGPRSQFAAVVFEDKFWIFGGWPDTIGCFTWYSPNGINWVRLPNPIPMGRPPECIWNHVVVVFQEKIWIFTNYPRNEIWCSADGDSWILMAESTSWTMRILYPLAVFDNKLWAMGGWIASGDSGFDVNDVWCSLNGVDWQCITENAPWSPREGHTVLVKDDKLWLLGGRLDLPEPATDTFFNDVWYTPDGDTWICATDSAGWSGRWEHASVVFDSCLWVMGGYTQHGSQADIWYSTGLSSGAIEETKPFTQFTSLPPTIIRSISQLVAIHQPAILLDPTGRQIADLRPGTNIRNLKPGIYFLLLTQTNTDAESRRQTQNTQKIVFIE